MIARLVVVLIGLTAVGAVGGLVSRWVGELYGRSTGLACGIVVFCIGMALVPPLVRFVVKRVDL